MYNTEEQHGQLRQSCSEWLMQNGSFLMDNGEPLSSFVTGQPWKDYCETMMRAGTWGDHIEILALSGVLCRTIVVYRFGNAQPERISWPGNELSKVDHDILLSL
jgi:hypothetical protein